MNAKNKLNPFLFMKIFKANNHLVLQYVFNLILNPRFTYFIKLMLTIRY
jgi:hypothetical protein